MKPVSFVSAMEPLKNHKLQVGCDAGHLTLGKRKELRISDDRLSRLLYTDEDEETTTRLGYHIKDSDRPLAMKAATIDFIRQFNFFMNRNPHLKNMRVSDVMKLSDSN